MKEIETNRTAGRWIGDKLVWKINGKDVTDSELRAWCHQNMEYPKQIIGACVLQMHVDAYAKANQ